MPESLKVFDAVLAVRDEAINRGIEVLHKRDGDREINLDLGENNSFTATMGPPRLQFLAGVREAVRLTFYMTGVSYVSEGKKVKVNDGPISFLVALKSLTRATGSFQDEDFSIAQLSLDLSKLRAIQVDDPKALKVKDAHLKKFLKGLVKHIQQEYRTDPQSMSPQLGLSFVQRQRTTSRGATNTKGNMRATGAMFSVTTQAPLKPVNPWEPVPGDLNYLLMTGERPLPADASAEPFDIPWATGAAGTASSTHDGLLILSDYMLMDAVFKPMLEKAYPGIKLNLDRSSGLRLAKAPFAIPNSDGTLLDACQVTMKANNCIAFEFKFSKPAPLKIGGIDLTLYKPILKHERSLQLKIESDKNGDLRFRVEKDQARDLPPQLKPNFEVRAIWDVGKYLAAPLAAMPVAWPFLALSQVGLGVANLIKALASDHVALKQSRDRLQQTCEQLTQGIELTGGHVLRFTTPRVNGHVLLLDANFVPKPMLRVGKVKPFEIRPFPKLGKRYTDLPDSTEPELIAEACIEYRLVNDPQNVEHQADNIPYYVLRREQFWKRLHFHKYGAKETDSKTFQVTMTAAEKTSMENTTSFSITSTGKLEYASCSLETAVEIKNELKMESVAERTTETQETYKRDVEHEKGDVEAIWTIVDRFTLIRPRDNSVVGQPWDFLHKDYVVTDMVDEHGKSKS